MKVHSDCIILKMGNCPDCKKPKLSNNLNHCVYCGLIFLTYKPNKSIIRIKPKEKECYACKSTENLQRHHIIPQRIKRNNKTIILCKPCHKIADLLATKFYEGIEILIKP